MKKVTTGACNACAKVGAGTIVLSKMDAYGPEPMELVRCPFCDTIYMKGQTFDASLYEYYEWDEGRSKEELFDSITRKRYLALLQWLGGKVGGRRVIDIGCGRGDFLDAALSAGWDAMGVELSPAAARLAVHLGLPVVNRDIFLPVDDLGAFDLLTMFEVIEHVEDPARLVQRAEELVRPGGYVYISTPNFDSLDRRLLGAAWTAVHREHLTYFTPRTLRQLVSRYTNLNIAHISTRNVSVGCLIHLRNMATGRKKGETTSMTPKALHEQYAKSSASFRGRIESAPGLRRVRDALNVALNLTSLGESMVALLERPASA